MRIAYINSEGKTFEFTQNKKIRIKDADFHTFTYGYNSIELAYGVEVESFTKEPYNYPIELYFCGSAASRAELIADFHDAGVTDIATKKPGKLIRGEWYINCYIIEGDNYPHETQPNTTVMTASFFCPYPSWIHEESFQFLPQENDQPIGGLDFPTDFPLDFAAEEFGAEIREVDHYAPSHFLMRYYGPCADPRVVINGYPYQIFTNLESKEYLEIDSRKNSVTKFLTNGATADLYNSRSFEYSVFEKIPSGRLAFNWPGTFGYDLILYLERSVPK